MGGDDVWFIRVHHYWLLNKQARATLTPAYHYTRTSRKSVVHGYRSCHSTDISIAFDRAWTSQKWPPLGDYRAISYQKTAHLHPIDTILPATLSLDLVTTPKHIGTRNLEVFVPSLQHIAISTSTYKLSNFKNSCSIIRKYTNLRILNIEPV
jgi:hypothetical protein